MTKDADNGAEPRASRDATRELFVLSAGGSLFAVFAEETDGVAENLRPVPLPHAPAAVLGVVSVRGRMRTLLYPPALLDDGDARAREHEDSHERDDSQVATPRFVVALRGDEQLALAADEVEGPLTTDAEVFVNADTDSPATSDSHADSTAPPLRATLEREGRRVHVLDTSRIFDAAMRGTERRRPRL